MCYILGISFPIPVTEETFSLWLPFSPSTYENRILVLRPSNSTSRNITQICFHVLGSALKKMVAEGKTATDTGKITSSFSGRN
jgi:hypothetical protein